jgi:medium-chain acyl-[acyl-carrier-protein] hydrolase
MMTERTRSRPSASEALIANPASSRWLVRHRPAPDARLRLVCLPFVGGGASLFRFWPELLSPAVEVCAVQLPGRETRLREPAHRRVGPLVLELAEVLAHAVEPPFAIFGHSMGALVSFELARQMRRRGMTAPRLLIASGRAAPQLPLRRRPIHALPEPDFRDELRKLEGTPAAVLDHDELMALFSPTLRADFALNETYRYNEEPPLDLPILALGGVDDPWVSREELEGWRAQTAASFDCAQFPGKHFYFQTATAEVLATVGRALARLEIEP